MSKHGVGISSWKIESKVSSMIRGDTFKDLRSVNVRGKKGNVVGMKLTLGSRPSSSNLITLNRSPHGNKKHRDQFISVSRYTSLIVRGKALDTLSVLNTGNNVSNSYTIRYGRG